MEHFPGSVSCLERHLIWQTLSNHVLIIQSSSPGEFHPQALTDPDVTVSRHPALIIELPSLATLPYLPAPPISG